MPCLGLSVDPDTNKDFPYEGNTCYRVKKPTPVAMSHQSGYCLTNEHTTCPGYIKGWADGFPKSLRAYPPTYERVIKNIWTWAALTMVLLVSAYLIFSQKSNTLWINLGRTEVSQFNGSRSTATRHSADMLATPSLITNVQTIPTNTNTSPTMDDNGSSFTTDNTETSEITDTSIPTLTSSAIETTNQTALELPYMVEVITNALNIRSGPIFMANGSNIVDTLVKGEIIEVFEEKGWLRAEKGWIFKYYTNIVEY